MSAVDKYKQIFFDWCDDFDKRTTSKYSIANKAVESGVRPAFVLIGLSTFLLLFSLWKCGQNVTSNLIGFIFPTYFSFVALRTEGTDDDVQWLTYWVVYAFFVCGESVSDLFINWVPLYYVVKSLLLVWLMHPNTQGAKIVFHNVIDPVLTKLEEAVDAVFNEEKRSELKAKLTSKDTLMSLKKAIPSGVQNDFKEAAMKEAKDSLKAD